MCSTCPSYSRCCPGKPCAANSKVYYVDYYQYSDEALVAVPSSLPSPPSIVYTPILAPINTVDKLSMKVAVTCDSSATFTFAGWVRNRSEGSATIGLQVRFVNDYTVGLPIGVAHYPVATIDSDAYGAITAVQVTKLPAGSYTVYLAIYNLGEEAVSIHIAGTLSYVIVKQ